MDFEDRNEQLIKLTAQESHMMVGLRPFIIWGLRHLFSPVAQSLHIWIVEDDFYNI
jgi:hypothetical protein